MKGPWKPEDIKPGVRFKTKEAHGLIISDNIEMFPRYYLVNMKDYRLCFSSEKQSAVASYLNNIQAVRFFY